MTPSALGYLVLVAKAANVVIGSNLFIVIVFRSKKYNKKSISLYHTKLNKLISYEKKTILFNVCPFVVGICLMCLHGEQMRC